MGWISKLLPILALFKRKKDDQGTNPEDLIPPKKISVFKRIFSSAKDKTKLAANKVQNPAQGPDLSERVGEGLDKIFTYLKFALGFLLVPAGFIFAIIKGVMPLNSIGTWIFVFFFLLFLISVFTHRNVLLVTSIGGMIFSVMFLSNLTPLVDALEENTNIDFSDFKNDKGTVSGASIISQQWKTVKCSYGTILDPENPKPECVEPLVDVKDNKQEAKSDISIVSFSIPKTVIPQQTILVDLNMKNEGNEDRNVNVTITHSTAEGGNPVQRVNKPVVSCRDAMDLESGYFCITNIKGGSERSVTIPYEVFDKDFVGSVKFDVNVSYNSTLTSTLLLKATDNLQEKRAPIQSEATAGSANLILAAQNQPLYKGDAFQFAFNIKNNHNRGAVTNAEAKIYLPKEMIAGTDEGEEINCLNKNGINVAVDSEVLNERDYYTLTPAKIDYIPDSEVFLCTLKVKDSVGKGLTRNVYGHLNYTYDLTDSATVVVQGSA